MILSFFVESFPAKEYKELDVQKKANFLTLVRAGIASEQAQIELMTSKKVQVRKSLDDARSALDAALKDLEKVEADVGIAKARRNEMARVLLELEAQISRQEATHKALLRRKDQNFENVARELSSDLGPQQRATGRRSSLMDVDEIPVASGQGRKCHVFIICF